MLEVAVMTSPTAKKNTMMSNMVKVCGMPGTISVSA